MNVGDPAVDDLPYIGLGLRMRYSLFSLLRNSLSGHQNWTPGARLVSGNGVHRAWLNRSIVVGFAKVAPKVTLLSPVVILI